MPQGGINGSSSISLWPAFTVAVSSESAPSFDNRPLDGNEKKSGPLSTNFRLSEADKLSSMPKRLLQWRPLDRQITGRVQVPAAADKKRLCPPKMISIWMAVKDCAYLIASTVGLIDFLPNWQFLGRAVTFGTVKHSNSASAATFTRWLVHGQGIHFQRPTIHYITN